MNRLHDKYRIMFENMAQGALYVQNDGTIIEVNTAALEIFGLTRSDFVGRSVLDPAWEVCGEDGSLRPPEHRPCVRALRTGEPVGNVICGIHNPHKECRVWISVSAVPLFAEGQDQPAQVLVTLSDISEQRRVSDIYAARFRLMRFSETHPLDELLVETLNEVERITGSLISFYHFYDARLGEAMLQAWSSRTSSEFCNAEGKWSHYPISRAGIWADAIRTGRPVIHNRYDKVPERRGLPEGHAALVRELVVPVHRDGVVVAVMGVGNKESEYTATDVDTVSLLADLAWDIAERKRHEQQMIESSRRFEQLVGTSMDGFWITTMEGKIVATNDAACRMYGYSRDELLAMSIADFDAVENEEEMREHIAEIARNLYGRFETLHRRKDGSLINVEVGTTYMPQSRTFLAFLRDISAHRSFELALQKSEVRYRAIVNSQLEFVDRYLPGGILTFVNDALCRYIDLPAGDLLGKSFYPFVHEADRDALIRAVEGLDAEHPMATLETRVLLRDGSVRWHQWTHHALLDGDGKVVEYQSVGRDITEQKEIQDKLRESEARFRNLLENVPNVAVQGYGPDGTVHYWNKANESIYGYPPEEALGRNIVDLIIPEEMQEEVRRAIRRGAETGEMPPPGESMLKRKDGSKVPVLSSHAVVRPPGRAPEMYCIDVDLSAHKTIEECLAFLANVSTKLEEQEDFFHLLAQYLARTLEMEFICIDRLEEGNLSARTLAYYIDGTFHDNLSYTLQDTPCGEVLENSLCCYPSGVRHLFPKDPVLQELTAESYVGTELWSSQGRPIGLVAAIGKKPLVNPRHATEILQMVRSRASAELERRMHDEERLKLELQLLHAQKLESLGILAGGIAHDFNNILTGILGNTSIALMRLAEDSPAVENLKNIEKGTARAADLARQMLAYSGKGMFVVEPVDLNHLLEEMIHLMEVSITKKASLQLNLAHEIPAVEGDPTQLRQVVMNLVINGSEAIGEEGGNITITTTVRHCDEIFLRAVSLDRIIPEGDYVCLEIADTGCGMDQNTISRIFDPFFTTKFTGRGLGMSAVLGIIKGHKGAIAIDSSVERGSTFTIYLPASTKAVVPIREAEDLPWKGNGTVLLVDDEESICLVGREMLRELGYEVVTAGDGYEALDRYVGRKDISLVILDLTMPRLDGEQTFIELRKIDPSVKVILSSGYSEQEVTKRFNGKGLVGFIQKPYTVGALRGVLKAVTAEG